MSEEKEKPKNTQKRPFNWRFLLLLILAIVYSVAARLIFNTSFGASMNWDVVSISFIFGVPVGIGALATVIVPPSENSWIKGISISAGIVVVFLSLTVIAALEIWICVLMAAVPMLLVAGAFYLLVALIGWLWNRFNPNGEKPKRMSVISLFVFLLFPYLLAPIEAQVKTPDLYQTVEDSILIENSSPEIVWENIIRMDTISSEEQFPTLFQMIGIPRPIRASLREEGLGQLRVGEFEYGLRFQEVITVWEPYQEVAFTIRVNHNNLESPALSQIGGEYLDIVEAAYRIEPLADGQIRLHLQSTYRVTTNFNAYAAFWADWIMHDFQAYVLRTAKARIEN